jgi:tetratricopeptide (TPR) repeat protein
LAHLVVWPAWFLGKAWCCLGKYGSAIARLTEAYEVCDRLGDRAWKARMLNTLGWCFAEIGSYARAREHNERASALARAIGDAEAVANSEINLAGNHLALGDVARARAHVEPILETLGRPGDPWMRWRFSLHATDVLGRIVLAESAPERAVALADEEEAAVSRHQVPKVGVRAALLRGAALLDLERAGEAESSLTGALASADRIGYPRGAWQALGLLAELKRRAGQVTEAETYATRRRAVVERLALSLREPELRQQLIAVATAPRPDR